MSTTVENPFGAVPREPRFGRPLIIPIGGGKLTPYTRCTTYVGALEDTYKLEQWKCRMTALGLAGRPDLQLATVAHKDDKDRLNDIVESAIEYAKASAPATIGTAVHTLTEQLDRGLLDIETVPEAYRGDLRAYQEATAGIEMLAIEEFMVNDALKIGGTPDRRAQVGGNPYVFDLKTGSIDYGMLKIAMQLAVYAHCQAYDPGSGERCDVTVDQDRAIVCHLPAGTGTCHLYWVDIRAGWEAVELATQVREWRKRKGLHSLLQTDRVGYDPDPILTAIAAATEVGQLRMIWAESLARRGGWEQRHTDAAAVRKAEIVNGVPA